MIVGLKGRLQAIGSGFAVVSVGGVSLQLFMPSSTLSTLGAIGEEVALHTHLHLREDNVTLYGFATAEELGLFQALLTVSGVGPKLALVMLSVMSAPRLNMAITAGSAEVLAQIPGIGKRTAERLILELKDKLAAGAIGAPEAMSQEDGDVMAALTSLGYSAREAGQAVATLPADKELDLEAKIKLALHYFGGQQEL